MLFPKEQIEMVVSGAKTCTLRKPSYKIKTGKEHKFVNSFKYGAFATAWIESKELISVDDIDDELAKELGYSNRSEYLQNGWNDEFNERLLIRFHIVDVDWDTVKKIYGVQSIFFDWYPKSEDNEYDFGQITFFDDFDEKIDVINVDCSEEAFRMMYEDYKSNPKYSNASINYERC